MVDELSAYTSNSIISLIPSDPTLQTVENVLSLILNQARSKMDIAKINSSVISNLKNQIAEAIKLHHVQQIPEILIWFAQEMSLTRNQIEFLQRMWAQNAYFQIANYLSQYDEWLRNSIVTQDPFKFNESPQHLIDLFVQVQKRLNKLNSENKLETDLKRLVSLNRRGISEIEHQNKLLNYMTKNACNQRTINKVFRLIGSNLYKRVIEMLFPNLSGLILRRYQQITRRFVFKEEDLSNILEMIEEGWLGKEINVICPIESEGNYRYFEGKKKEFAHNRRIYFSSFTHFYEP
jgi:hypothetical protein